MPRDDVEWRSVKALKENIARSNSALLKGLKEDENAAELLRLTRADADALRMTIPVTADLFDTNNILLHPRFGVPKSKANGSKRVRPVDNFSWSAMSKGREESVNGLSFPQEKMKSESLDALADALQHFREKSGMPPGLWKADIADAFRRVPIKPDHRWASGIAFRIGNEVRFRAFG